MTHLTLTGPNAGTVLCGAPKTADNQYLHAMYAPIEKLARGVKNFLEMWHYFNRRRQDLGII